MGLILGSETLDFDGRVGATAISGELCELVSLLGAAMNQIERPSRSAKATPLPTIQGQSSRAALG